MTGTEASEEITGVVKIMEYSVNFANYTIGETAYEAVAEVCRPFGKRIFLIGGKLAMQAGKEKLESQIKKFRTEHCQGGSLWRRMYLCKDG